MKERRLVQVRVTPELLVAFVSQSKKRIFSVSKGSIPVDALLVNNGYDSSTEQFFLTFAHKSFAVVPKGARVPWAEPMLFEEIEDVG